MTTTTPYPSQLLQSAMPAQNIAAPSYNLATIATGQFGRHVVSRAGKLENIVYNCGTPGTAGSTVFRFRRIPAGSGTAANIGGAITIANDAADGVVGVAAIDLDVAVGDVIECNVTTASTNGANLAWSPNISQPFRS